jgi:hypothetical protein
LQKIEQRVGMLCGQDPSKTPALDDRMGLSTEITDIGKAYPIDPGRHPTRPSTPYEPTDIEEEGPLVATVTAQKHFMFLSFGSQTPRKPLMYSTAGSKENEYAVLPSSGKPPIFVTMLPCTTGANRSPY